MFRQNLSCGKQRKTRNEETLTRFFNDGSATAVEPETFLSLCYFVSFQNLVEKKNRKKANRNIIFHNGLCVTLSKITCMHALLDS